MGIELLLQVLVAAAAAYVVVFWFGLIVWTYRDISARSTDRLARGFFVCLVLLFNLPGLLVYVLLRPQERLAEAYDRLLEEESLLQEMEQKAICPGCSRRVREDFLICPYCKAELKKKCGSCGSLLHPNWIACPYCGH